MSSSQAPSPRLADKIWQDFDDKAVFEDVSDNAAAAACQNFVLEFGPTRARIARDVSQDDFQDLLGQEKRDTEYPIRWMWVWHPSVGNADS